MITNPTPAQERAMQLTGCNLIVSAAAGSGKTAVMVDRAVRSLAGGQDLSRLLMVTFTNAAAAQMKQRIAKELAAAVQAAEGAQKAHLRRQLSMVHSSEITTIDSFCLHLVRRYFHLVDIDPLFSLCGPAEQTILISQALDDVLDACFDESAHGFLCALEALCGGDEAQLRALIARVYQFARTSDDPGAWAARARSFYDGRGATEQAVSLLKEDLQSQLHAFAAQALTAADALDARLIGTQKPPAMQKSLRTAAQQAQMCLSLSPGPALSDALRAIRFPAMALRNAGGLGEAEFAPVRAAVQQARETLSRMQDHLLLHAGEQGCMQMLCSMREPVHALLDLVDQFAQAYTAKKRERNLLDFADLEHLALQILRDPQAQKEVQQRYECVYIDEYQDTNDLQEALLTRVARPGALFCVGDVKQSIYAFRHAEPALFIRRYAQSAPDAPQCDKPQAPDVRIDLNQNFRSTRTLIDCINAVFARAMSREVGGLAYDETQALQAGLDTDGDPVRFILLQTDGQESKALQTDGAQEQALPQSAIERTAAVIAQRVHELLRTERVPGDADSHYRYSDIAILCRALGTDGPALLTALTAQGIPVSSNLSGGVLQAQETGAMLSLLRAIDNARDDLAMLGALRSPAALCTAQDLARIRIQSDEPFALAVAQYAENGEGESADRIRAFWKQFTAWRALSRQVTVDELLTDIFEQTDALSYYALQPGGAQKVENLQALWMSAQSFSALGDGSLYGFLQMLQLHQQLGVDEMPAPAKGEDAVQLMTIHASKGLEFPAVIVPFLQKRFRFSSDAVCLSKAFGLGVKTYDFATQTVQDGPIRQLALRQKRQQELSEELRVFYVALTRAKASLTLIAQGAADALAARANLAPEDATCALDWLLPVLVQQPGAQALCQCMGLAPQTPLVHGRWQVDIVPASAPLAAFAAQSHEDTENLPQSEADADFSWVDARLSYRYPHDAQTHLVSKISVTALMQDAPAAYTPLEPLSFSPQPAGAFSAAEVGTLVHRAMCKLDVAGAQSRDALTRQLDEMTARGIFTAQQRAALPLPMLLRFAISPMGQRLSQSRRVLREQPFNVQVPATLLEPSAPGDAFTLLQGILDCAFWEDDGWVLLDYKTNRIPPNGPQALIDTYRTQLDLYRYALGTLTSAPVRACYLCLLRSGDALSVAPGATFEVLAKGKASG